MATERQMRPTLRDVATRAGVSISTASLVFSGKGPVSEATASRVRTAAADIGFSGPDPLASSLRQGRSGVIGVVIEGRVRHAFRDPFAISILDGLAEVLDTVPTGLLLLGQPADHPGGLLPQISGLALDAVVFSLCTEVEIAVVDHLEARGIPMVGTGAPLDDRVVQVRIDERAAGRTVAEHVRSLGHERVAHVTLGLPAGVGTGRSTPEAGSALGRLLGFRDVFGPDAAVVSSDDGSSVEGGLRAGRALLTAHPTDRPTAIVAQSDVIAAGVVLAAEELGLEVPGDLTVTGFDGVDLPWLPHRLTTMDQHGSAKGRELGRLVEALLAGDRPTGTTQAVPLRVGTTSAPPRPAAYGQKA